MEKSKWPPRVWLLNYGLIKPIKHPEKFHTTAFSYEAGDGVEQTEYLSLAEHEAILAEKEALLDKAYLYILNNREGRKDFACRECVPDGSILCDGFVCAYHEAKAAEIRCEKKEK